jgi:hypothetical protein
MLFSTSHLFMYFAANFWNFRLSEMEGSSLISENTFVQSHYLYTSLYDITN